MCSRYDKPCMCVGSVCLCGSIIMIFIAGYLWTSNHDNAGFIVGIISGCFLISASICCCIPNRCWHVHYAGIFPTHIKKEEQTSIFTDGFSPYDKEEAFKIISEN